MSNNFRKPQRGTDPQKPQQKAAAFREAQAARARRRRALLGLGAVAAAMAIGVGVGIQLTGRTAEAKRPWPRVRSGRRPFPPTPPARTVSWFPTATRTPRAP